MEADFGEGFHSAYRSIVGGLLWIAVSTRPDISFAVIQVAKYVCAPSYAAFVAAVRVLRYLAGTRTFGLFYRRS